LAVRLFVGNLSYATTEADLRSYFGTIAAPSQVVLPVDRETGRPRGFAFVEFQDRAHAEQAIQKFNGQVFNGRPLAVSEARAREDRGPGGPRFDPTSAPQPPRNRNFGPDAKPSRGPGAKKAKKDAERPRGPIPTKFTGRSFSLDDEKDAGGEDIPDMDNFATSQPHDDDDDKDE